MAGRSCRLVSTHSFAHSIIGFRPFDAWNATVQRQITPTITATVSYVGNKGTHTIGGGPDYPFNNPALAGYDPSLSGQSRY